MNIKMLVLDVDGTLTDGKIYMGNDGELFKAFNCHDVIPLKKLSLLGITTVIMTKRFSNIVSLRAKEMDISEVYQGVTNKCQKLEELSKEKKLSYDEIGYIGDDENDYDAMIKCGFKACPNDAIEKIKKICDYVSPKKCSESAVGEIINTKIIIDSLESEGSYYEKKD